MSIVRAMALGTVSQLVANRQDARPYLHGGGLWLWKVVAHPGVESHCGWCQTGYARCGTTIHNHGQRLQ
eukprot:1485349-Prorocentrum_lima.AAC.1